MAEILSETYSGVSVSADFIMHYGAKGQKWGLRRWQNEDGSLTPAGRIHYGVGEGRGQKKFLTKEERAERRAERKEARAQRKEERAEAKEAKKAEDLENKKQKIIADADPETVVKNRALLSTAEFNEAFNRAMLTKKTSELIVPKEGKLDKFIKIGTKVADTMKMINNVKEQRDKLFELDEKKKLALEIAKETRQEQRDIAKEQRQEERTLMAERRKEAKKNETKEPAAVEPPKTVDLTHKFLGQELSTMPAYNNSYMPAPTWATKADTKASYRQRKAAEEVAKERAALNAKAEAKERKSLIARVSSMTAVSSSNPASVSLDKPISVVSRLGNTTYKDAGVKKIARSMREGRDYESILSTSVKSLSASWAPEPDEKKKKKKANSDLSFLKLYGM